MAHLIDEFPGRTITTKDGTFLYFGGTAYLGLQTLPEFQELYIKNIKKYGTNYGASRKSNIQFSIFEETESHLATKIGAPKCCTLSSGYLASQLVSQLFSTGQYQKFIAPHSHSSLIGKGDIQFKEIEGFRKAFKNPIAEKTPVIFLDSVDFTRSTYPNYTILKGLDLSKSILVLDDSHGFGIIGQNGSGVYGLLQQFKAKEIVVCGSLGKGFGIQAGAIFGDEERIASIKKSNFFGGASPALPAAMATLKEAESIYKSQLKKLRHNTVYFSKKLNDKLTFTQLGDHPTYTFFSKDLTEHLYQKNILITSFHYPTENDPLMSRIVLNAQHTKEDLDQLLEALHQFTL
ncbi:aminotransferase class I/II-fold pyridoxal phosphate-dependent enzyme [Galbibacter sp. BG1]|uniref:aminotransferase class I/II-fold pyridoxal phosphate-dependent enzyme n=1 Tax=Galbibacter sp. BG1 TaxID=1170699 RepID=UPI0015B8C403|nr:aminotransferase class I/II-fold pyridoxal phosphate-dependent enzyme [Galbibacter sp. BG1]QLE02177.1 aminotransferase class I/II-fold pyridoxal phosphate-dependent enzyme [Galbibacter sp. BG1]